MKEYMRIHLRKLKERASTARNNQQWTKCIELEARIVEAEYLYTEMLKRGLLLKENEE